jgi:hypothetical protein
MGRYGYSRPPAFAIAHKILSAGKKTPAPRGIPVESSLLRSVAWRDGLLYVRFDNDAALGKLFIYENVPESVFKQLMAAKSQGSFFVRNVRDAYSYSVRERK